ncbi:hypothetical protein GGH96_002313 [Coemansia sp. RSA 1972]|nr:hypothetical protein GGH96_002313 [Coemansia sp. RSA 1972]
MLYSKNEFVFSAGAVVFDAKLEQVLIIVYDDNGRVSFPKGQLDKGETIECAARREVEEEAGVVCNLWPSGIVAVQTRYYEDEKKTKFIYWYAATFVETTAQKLEEYEHITPKWIDVASAADALTRAEDKKLEFMLSAGAVVFDAKREHVLTVVGDNTGHVSFPKGQIDKGESIECAARREVEEEAGVVCNLWPCGIVAVETRFNEVEKKQKIIYWYAATLVETTSQKLEEYERLTPKWIDVASAADALTWADDKRLLQLCLESIRS